MSERFPLTREQAAFVRGLRVDDQHTWRGVADLCATEWAHEPWADWQPPSNQIAGLRLCEQAAALLGEDAWTQPWN